jgi:hypothetical protein
MTTMVSAKRMASSMEWVDQHRRRAACFDQPGELLLQHEPSLCVERAKRFVKQQDIGLHDQSSRESNSLTHTARELTRVLGFKTNHINLGQAASRSFDALFAWDAGNLKAKGDIVGNSAPRE